MITYPGDTQSRTRPTSFILAAIRLPLDHWPVPSQDSEAGRDRAASAGTEDRTSRSESDASASDICKVVWGVLFGIVLG